MFNQSEPSGSPRAASNLLEDKVPRAKAMFISKLKAFIKQEKGDYILDQLLLCVSQDELMMHNRSSEYGGRRSSTVGSSCSNLNGSASPGHFEVALDFDIDLIKMIHYD